MKQDQMSRSIDEVIALKLKAVDEYIKEVIEPIGDIGSPERLIGKRYEEMTDLDKMMLTQIYGAEPNTWSRLRLKKDYEEVLALERLEEV